MGGEAKTRGSLPWAWDAGCRSPPAPSFCRVLCPHSGGGSGGLAWWVYLKHGRGNRGDARDANPLRAGRGFSSPQGPAAVTQRVLPLAHHRKGLVPYPGLRGSPILNSSEQILWRHIFFYDQNRCWPQRQRGSLLSLDVEASVLHVFITVPAPHEQEPAAWSW